MSSSSNAEHTETPETILASHTSWDRYYLWDGVRWYYASYLCTQVRRRIEGMIIILWSRARYIVVPHIYHNILYFHHHQYIILLLSSCHIFWHWHSHSAAAASAGPPATPWVRTDMDWRTDAAGSPPSTSCCSPIVCLSVVEFIIFASAFTHWLSLSVDDSNPSSCGGKLFQIILQY